MVPLIVIADLAAAVRRMANYSRTGDVIGTFLMSFSSFGYFGQILFNRAYICECVVKEMPAGDTPQWGVPPRLFRQWATCSGGTSFGKDKVQNTMTVK